MAYKEMTEMAQRAKPHALQAPGPNLDPGHGVVLSTTETEHSTILLGQLDVARSLPWAP